MPKTEANCCNSSSGNCVTEFRAVACNCMVASAPATAPTATQPAIFSLAPMYDLLPDEDDVFNDFPV